MTHGAATRLVRLYPGSWRARYGDELAHVLAAQPLTPRIVIDIIGGAIDARLHRPVTAPTGADGGKMTSSLMKRCASGGPRLTRQEQRRANGVMIGASLALGAAYVWAKMLIADSDFVDAYGIMAFPAAMIIAMPFSYLKDASRTAQIVIVGGLLLFLAAVSYVTALI
jgi:hypothetical protein